MHEARKIRARQLHQVHILMHQRIRLGVAGSVAVAHAVEAADADALAVEQEGILGDLHFADAEAVGFFVENFSARRKLRREPVKIWMIKIPKAHARLRQTGFRFHFNFAVRGNGDGFRQRGFFHPVKGCRQGNFHRLCARVGEFVTHEDFCAIANHFPRSAGFSRLHRTLASNARYFFRRAIRFGC